MRFSFLILICAVCGWGCHRASPEDEAAALATVRANVAAMERNDMEGVMATVHSESPQFDANHDVLIELFDRRFTLKYTLSDLKVVGAKSDEIRVHFLQRTEKVAGADSFNNNTVEGVHVLKKEDGSWKIHSTPSLRIKEMTP